MSTRHLSILLSTEAQTALQSLVLHSRSTWAFVPTLAAACSSTLSSLVNLCPSPSRNKTQFWPCSQTKVWLLILTSYCCVGLTRDWILFNWMPLFSPLFSQRRSFQWSIPFTPSPECQSLVSLCMGTLHSSYCSKFKNK